MPKEKPIVMRIVLITDDAMKITNELHDPRMLEIVTYKKKEVT